LQQNSFFESIFEVVLFYYRSRSMTKSTYTEAYSLYQKYEESLFRQTIIITLNQLRLLGMYYGTVRNGFRSELFRFP